MANAFWYFFGTAGRQKPFVPSRCIWHWKSFAVFTLETYKSSGLTDKLSQTGQVVLVWKRGVQIQTNEPSEFDRRFVRLWRFLEDDLSTQKNKSTKVRPEFTLAEQIVWRFLRPDDLFVSSLKTKLH